MFSSATRRTRDAEFAAFVQQASARLTRTAYLLTGDREIARDLVQEALVRTYRAWGSVRTQEAGAYARRVLVNVNIDRWRRRPAEPRWEVERVDPADAMARVDDRDEVVRMLAKLPAQQRKVIVLRYFGDLTEAGTAQVLGISVGAVKSATSRGLGTLRSLYVTVEEGGRS